MAALAALRLEGFGGFDGLAAWWLGGLAALRLWQLGSGLAALRLEGFGGFDGLAAWWLGGLRAWRLGGLASFSYLSLPIIKIYSLSKSKVCFWQVFFYLSYVLFMSKCYHFYRFQCLFYVQNI
ncbi:MAG: hypothetical protein RR827_05020 [Oscillospiraceae bacterium]